MKAVLSLVVACVAVVDARASTISEALSAQETYLEKCGGKIYSKCDDPNGMNQDELFNIADAEAVKHKKRVVLNFGADWCPTCRHLAVQEKSNPALMENIRKNYVYIKVNSDVSSGKALARRLKINVPGYPVMAIYDPLARKAVETFFPTAMAFAELESKLTSLARGIKNEPVQEKDSDFVGNVRRSLLDKPLENVGPGWGESDLVISTRLNGDEARHLQILARQGMVYFHNFYYVAAYRSLATARKLEPDNPVLEALQALAYKEIADKDYVPAAVPKEFPLSDEDRAFVRFAVDYICLNQPNACGRDDLHDKSQAIVAQNFLNTARPQKRDYISFAGFVSRNTSVLTDLLARTPKAFAANHYLVHLYESLGFMELALRHGELYASQAPKSPHAQHMYAHILPQVGRWGEAAKLLRRAHDLHLEEFAAQEMYHYEDWHYQHNTELLTSTLVYLNRLDEAKMLLDDGNAGMFLSLQLEALMGAFASANVKLLEYFKGYETHPKVLSIRILFALGNKDLALAQSLAGELKEKDEWESSVAMFARAALNMVEDKDLLTPAAALGDVKAQLAKPGFDSWSTGVMESRLLAKVLTLWGKTAYADKILGLAFGAHNSQLCKTTAPVCRNP